jgi:hypothetical protein
VKVSAKVGIATAGEIRRTRTGLIIRVSRGFEVEGFSGKSLTLKKAGLIVGVSGGFEVEGSSGKSLTLKEAGLIITASANVYNKREV